MTGSRRLILVLVVAAAILVGAGLAGTADDPVVSPAAPGGSPTASPSSSTSASPPSTPSTEPSSSPNTRPAPVPAPATATGSAGSAAAGPTSGPTPTTPTASASPRSPAPALGGIEHPSPAPSSTAYQLPGLGQEEQEPASPGVVARPPTTAHELDGYVDGFPEDLLRAAPRSTVLSTSVSPSRARVQVALTALAQGAEPADRVLRFYRRVLVAQGFEETEVTGVGGTGSAAFAREGGTVVVTVGEGRPALYSVYATLPTR